MHTLSNIIHVIHHLVKHVVGYGGVVPLTSIMLPELRFVPITECEYDSYMALEIVPELPVEDAP